ncbi:MAG: response regulator [Sulfuricurvum sp.]|uniref:response regulator transcription factor n=1 Tax=Sulfuricurvum sp. TaxID=2025608 RepID=UPI002735DEF1|nr:response regulator [Sulfuricurvum sp.]MDP3290934.1 response regulator [Sulfuricurvum sp.]
MITIKDVQNYSQQLSVLYVEDNDKVREETAEIFKLLFAKVETASNGQEGIEKYNYEPYDIVITDINMPRLNGIEMIFQIREINPEQKIIAISAHDEPETLISMMRKGVSTFLLKPISHDEMLKIIYPVCRDASAQNVNAELFEKLNEERKKYKKIVSKLMSHLQTVEIKNGQIEKLYAQNHQEERSELLEEYFAKDNDDECEKVIFLHDDCEEMTDILGEIPDKLSLYIDEKDIRHIHKTRDDVAKLSNILYRYTPFLDPLAKSLEELSSVVAQEEEFLAKFDAKPEQILSLFDAVCIDLSLYVKRFAIESMAMKNIHHIHQPTTLSIHQIIGLIRPDLADEGGDMDFF